MTAATASPKLLTLDQARKIRQEYRDSGRKVVFANGIFDVLHGGHVSYLAESRAMGDVLVVGLNSDASERALKGPSRPIFLQDERIEILAAIRFVDYIVVFEELTCENLLRELRPDIHVKGTDYTVETIPERQVAEELGIEARIAGPPKENASRGIMAAVVERYKNPAS